MLLLLYGVIIYMDACVLDLKSLFEEIDHLSTCRNSSQSAIERCKEAVELHAWMNRYAMNQNYRNVFVTRSPFQMLFHVSRCNEHIHYGDSDGVHRSHIYISACHGEGAELQSVSHNSTTHINAIS